MKVDSIFWNAKNHATREWGFRFFADTEMLMSAIKLLKPHVISLDYQWTQGRQDSVVFFHTDHADLENARAFLQHAISEGAR